MKKINCIKSHGCSPVPQEGNWQKIREIENVNGVSNAIGYCAPLQGGCKLTIRVNNGIIEEALIETIGCSSITQSSAIAIEIIIGLNIIEALNTDLVCDAINVAMRQVFLQLLYGRSQTAFSKKGIHENILLEGLGKNKRSMSSTMYSNIKDGPRYLENSDGYVTKLGLDNENKIIAYEAIDIFLLIKSLESGIDYQIALKEAKTTFGRMKEAALIVDPRE